MYFLSTASYKFAQFRKSPDAEKYQKHVQKSFDDTMTCWFPVQLKRGVSHGAERTAPGSGRQADGSWRGGFLMLSNPVYSKPFRGTHQEVTGATLGREGAQGGRNVDKRR